MALKRPATTKKEPATPPKRKRKAAEPEKAEEEPGKAEEEEEEAEEDEPDKAPASSSSNKPAKAAKPEKAPKPAKAKSSQGLAAPSKAAWNDMSYALRKLEKAGKGELSQARKEAQGGGQQAKRHFYYNVFLLDPTQSNKAVHRRQQPRGGSLPSK
eukprot:s4344_g1.t1